MRFIESGRIAELSRAVRVSSLKRFRRVPWEQANWQPAKGAMSIADLAQHLIDADQWMADKIHSPARGSMVGQCGLAEISSLQNYNELLARLAESGSERAQLIESLSEDDLAVIYDDDRFPGKVSLWWLIMRGNLDHEIHHRGQLSTYLRILRL